MNWENILLVEWVNPAGIKIGLGPIGIALLAITFIYLFFKIRSGRWEVIEAQLSIGQLGHIKLRRSPEIVRIAHQAWTELQTRKASLPFDEDHDMVIEVYDSWYVLFAEFRKLIKSVPIEQIKSNSDVEKLIETMVSVLNKGIRPHLTKWQGRYRNWWSKSEDPAPDLSPQDLQKRYAHYNEMISDIKRVNLELQAYSDFLKQLAYGKTD